MFNNAFSGKTVLVTGHTGFKGTWLSLWLKQLGASVYGFSIDIPSNPSMFEALNVAAYVDHTIGDVRDFEALSALVARVQPDFVFHLAAQPIVSLSYQDPLTTISTNAMGTANILEACRQLKKKCTVLAITSDKCYENVEWEWGYRETDQLGGKDIYSASKAAAEIVFNAYYQSFYKNGPQNVQIAAARAGNVIGGGDWAQDRIVVDCMHHWNQGKPVPIRSPQATRPWQHVLEPLSGYLTLAAELAERPELAGEAFNFGPKPDQNRTVVDLLSDLKSHWTGSDLGEAYEVIDNIPFNEAGLLKLNCDKALFHLKWVPTLTYDQCVEMVAKWYSAFYAGDADMYALTEEQLAFYTESARIAGNEWTTS